MKQIEKKVRSKLEKETEARLQMLPAYFDRRKFRVLIQRIKTQTRKDTREEALEEAYLEVAKYLTIRDEFGKMLKGEEILKKMKENERTMKQIEKKVNVPYIRNALSQMKSAIENQSGLEKTYWYDEESRKHSARMSLGVLKRLNKEIEILLDKLTKKK